MRRALRLAMNGRGLVEPNPMVGCALVKASRVIGEGYHAKFGGPHAEPTALANCTESPEGATAYVTLEPCCHTNKKTLPCAPRLIEAKVKRVVIGCLDPNPEVNGKGVAMLRAVGIEVDGPVLEGEAKQLIAPFILRTTVGRPYVTLKWAETADGKVGAPPGEWKDRFKRRLQISGPESTHLVHVLRSRSDAILVGMRTVVADDPTLTARGVESPRPLIRAVLGSGPLAMGGSLLKSSAEGPIILYSREHGSEADRAVEKLANVGVETVIVPETTPGRLSLPHVVKNLADRQVMHLLVEPGPTLAGSLFQSDVVDRLWVIRSSGALDSADRESAPIAAPLPERFVVTGRLPLGSDALTEYVNPNSAAFFAAVPSADFVLARDTVERRSLIPSPG